MNGCMDGHNTVLVNRIHPDSWVGYSGSLSFFFFFHITFLAGTCLEYMLGTSKKTGGVSRDLLDYRHCILYRTTCTLYYLHSLITSDNCWNVIGVLFFSSLLSFLFPRSFVFGSQFEGVYRDDLIKLSARFPALVFSFHGLDLAWWLTRTNTSIPSILFRDGG